LSIRIVASSEGYIAGFHAAVDVVARERKYLGFIQAPPLETTKSFVRGLLAGEGVQLLAVDAANKVVGWCDITRVPWEGARHVGRLGMGLLAPYRGQGHGRQLALQALEAARKAGIERVELDVFAANVAAIRFYESLDFEHEGLKRRYRKLDAVYDDCVIMAKLVT
jgi:RimJ/RimL family protein N-acetyltransferase